MSQRVLVLGVLVLVLAGARAILALGSSVRSDVGGLVARVDPDAVQRLRLVRNAREVVLERDPASPTGWVVASHGRIPARAAAPDAVVRRLCGWRRERIAGSDPAEFSEWGVREVEGRRVRLEDAEGQPLLDLLVGRVTGIDRDRARENNFQLDPETLGLFVRPQGTDTVFVVNDFLTRALEPVARNWFVRPLIPGRLEQLSGLRLRRGVEDIDLDLQPAPRLKADPRPVDPAQVFGRLRLLFGLEALGPAPAGGRVPANATELSLARREGEPVQLLLYSEGERWFLRRAALHVEVEASAARRVAETRLSDLVRRRLLPLQPNELRRAHWSEANGELSLVRRTPHSWSGVVAGAGAPPPRPNPVTTWYALALDPLRWGEHLRASVDPLREQLCSLEVERWDAQPESLGDVTERLVIWGRDPEPYALDLGRAADGLQALRLKGLGAVAWVKEDALRRVRSRWRALCATR